MVRICKSWEKQVLDNSNELEQLRGKVGDNTYEINRVKEDVYDFHTDLTEINQKLDRALVTPLQTPSATEIVAVDSTKSQKMLEIGEGLAVKNGVLSASGGASPFTLVFDEDISNLTNGEYAYLEGVQEKVVLIEAWDTESSIRGATLTCFGSYDGSSYNVNVIISMSYGVLALDTKYSDPSTVGIGISSDSDIYTARIKIYTVDLPAT